MKLALAPMEAVNCKAFRVLCKELGADLIYVAMIDVDILLDRWGHKGRDYFFDMEKKERPVAIQICGSDKETLLKAGKIVEKYCDFIDINLGCCEGDILGKKAGAYFLKHPELIERTFSPLIKGVKKPVSAKIRIGWDKVNAVEVSRILEKIGIKRIAIHGRTRIQGYRGNADWEAIKKVKESVNIPVIGNGDINKPGQAKFYLERGFCDMVMIGRKAKRDPDIFRRCKLAIENKPIPPANYGKIRKRFIELYKKQKRQKEKEMKEYLKWFI